MVEPNKPREPNPEQGQAEMPVVLDARQILQGKREIWIEHEGLRYRLRVTRRGRLILTK